MKRKTLSILLVVCIAIIALAGLTACDGTTAVVPQKLSAPVVTLTDNVASWEVDLNADKFEISLDGNLSYVENTVTEKTLTDGQTMKVRAVGDGNAYSTSDWSNSVTYTEDTLTPQATKLGTPAVTISNTGLASWMAVANASSYVYKINGGAETPTTATSVQLTDGQSIVVKAVGDGTSYTDGDYSTSQTYTAGAPIPQPTGAPTYLGIFASNNEPSQADGLPGAFSSDSVMRSYSTVRVESYRAFDTALDEYFGNRNNHLGATFPAAADYEIFSRAGETVYVQIWLNNPNQHTILSLKLNGTKYQVGGGLSSFFIVDDGLHYNCVYVAVTIPNGAYTEQTYTVTDIEYIADTYINADGTDEFMNNNDTVSIGLPYNSVNPVISDFNPTSLKINGCSATLTASDASGLVNLSGGWLGIAVYDGWSVIANQSLAIGNNSVSAAGLVENTDYWIVVYLYADLHDGNGVAAHILFEQHIHTPEAISVNEAGGTLLYDSVKDGYYGAINIKTTLNSNTAEYIKLEILRGEEVIYTDTSYNGVATVSEGILCGNSYNVRVYYKDTEYPEGKYIEEGAWVNSLGTPWYQEYGAYTFVNDAVYYFQLSNGDNNYPAIDSFSLKLFKKESARWVASDVLYILDNPTAIEELNARIDVLWAEMNELPRGEEMDSVYKQIQELQAILDPLEYALWYLESRADNNTNRAYWEDEEAKGKYFYEFEYSGTNTDKLFKVGKTFYVVLDDAITYGIGRFDIEIDYKYDNRDGNGPCDDKVNYQSIGLDRELTNHWVVMENVSYSDGELTLTLFNEPDWYTGVRPPYAIGYVYKVVVDGEILYLDNTEHKINVDEKAWFDEYIERINAGQTLEGLMEKYVPDYESSYTVPIDTSKLKAGYRNFGVYIRLVNTEYEDGEYHADRWAEGVAVYTQIQKPIIEYKELWGEYYGVVTPESLDNWYNDYYEYEAIDKNGNPVEITIASESGYARFYLPSAGTKVRVRIPASGYWLSSEWSEWYTFEGIKLSSPEFGEYDKASCKISWSADTGNVSHYLYTVNGGTPVRVETDGNRSVALNNGDVLRVMCVASEEAAARGYLDSEWTEYTCVDSRSSLAAPENVKLESGTISWDEVKDADYYVIEYLFEDGKTTERKVYKLSTSANLTAISFRVRAMSEDSENYRPSAWSESTAITSEKG